MVVSHSPSPPLGMRKRLHSPARNQPQSQRQNGNANGHHGNLNSNDQMFLHEKARDMTADWVVEQDLEVFRKALSEDPSETPGLNGESYQTEKIRAVSDFAPIRERVRKGPKRRRDIVREGWAYHVSRWPLLGIIFFVIFLQFLGYLAVRQLVNLIEYVSAWRGYKGKLRMALRKASTYGEWKERALALDNYLRLSDWKRSPPNAYYDSPLVRRVLRSLKDLREKEDVEGVRAVLEVCLKNNFAGVESVRLYSETFYGTKDLLQEYVEEVARSIAFIRTAPTTAISLEEKARFFRYSAKNLGSTALCLSGGASFGYYHFGVVRALLDAGLLPKVITGTSAGAIIAAFMCTRTEDELKEMLVPELADRITACEEPFRVWAARAWKTGARFDTIDWARKASFFTMGSMTFKEAYERTGKILNVSVIPYDTHSPTKLLNYLTAPDCVIYTAVIASAAVPGILNPVCLLTKDRDGKVHPWEFQGKHKDGSLRVDIPLQALHLLYNVNFSIVSQVNPHIHLFHFAPRGAPGRPVSHRSGKGWRGGFFLSAAEQFLKLELTKNFRVIRDLELLPELGGQNWSAVFLQKFEGTVTVWPKSRLLDWVHILTDPDRDELSRMIRVGQAVTWPKIKMIENRMKIEGQLDLAREEVHNLLSQQHSSTRAPLERDSSSSFDLLLKRNSAALPPGEPVPVFDSPTGAGSEADADTEPDSVSGKVTASNPVASTSSNGNGGRNDDHAPPTLAKKRKAILARLGLKQGMGLGHGASGANGGGGGDGRGGETTSAAEDSDFDTGRMQRRVGSMMGLGASEKTSSKELKRRFSMGHLGRRATDVFSSESDEGH
ncbi:patatin-domain-containing protein [Meredithblackwellia eburnea MCA 4105]